MNWACGTWTVVPAVGNLVDIQRLSRSSSAAWACFGEVDRLQQLLPISLEPRASSQLDKALGSNHFDVGPTVHDSAGAEG